MGASLENPIYTTYLVSGGVKYNLSGAVTRLAFSDQQKQISKSLKIDLGNIQVDGKRLSDIVQVRDRVFVHANDGEQKGEVYRGFVWTRPSKDRVVGNDMSLKCYDNLIYLQQSDDSLFFSSGKTTDSIAASICEKWGVKLEYTYTSITHSKLVLRGALSDMFTTDILKPVKDRTGKKYSIISEKDVMKIRTAGTNTTIYTIRKKNNATGVSDECTMDDVVTKVIILGKADDEERLPVEAEVTGKTSEYGTLQKTISRSENTTLEEAKEEAQTILDESGEPKWTYEVVATDIPWIRKGDMVKVEAGGLNRYFIVIGIDRDISNDAKTMTLTLEDV